ncbi:MAG: ATP-dependent DNA helicase RecG [Bacteroidaceae bacterium]|nr:ATP-dependent DNA helicase RecG [Bacteroidaceae bacterium]
MPGIDLNADIKFLPGVGPQRGKLLKEQMNISTLGDLLLYYPYKHIDRSRVYHTYELSGDMPFVQLRGQILSFTVEGVGRKRRLVGHFTDGHEVVDLVWFNGIDYTRRNYREHVDYIVFGKPTFFGGRFNITHPDIDPADSLMLSTMGMQPYYSVPDKVKKRGINSRTLEHLTNNLFGMLKEALPETLSPSIIGRFGLMSRDEAIRAMHYPKSAQQLSQATYRLKFEELFFVQLNILKTTQERQKRVSGYLFSRVGQLFNDFYYHHLPFPLTEAQKRVIREMHGDMKTGRQMNRLLQGDVGSGKTMVALMTILIALDNGFQAVIMAPTEILAEQHLATFQQLLGDMPVRVELLTGTVKGKRRKAVLEGLEAGDVHILVGTHAVIEDNVKFKRLGLAIIDEQHRFGVAQRGKLWSGYDMPPHVLVMTATPIPRTLAMTVYGDLDVSVIDELPPGRKPVKTLHQYDERRNSLYHELRTQIGQGRQAYVVYPLIKESERIDLKNLEDGYEQLRQAFPDLRISKVHGKMKPSEKDEQMRLFASGETQILVATTVIEVGVNVPNASVMIIENADRFGLAQLHQLRGRVGRGADQSYCILVTGYNLGQDTRRRIQIMTETCDGFEIAEEDMKLRGPGDLEGTQQSGIAFELHIANLGKDGQIVQQARDVAKEVLARESVCPAAENTVLWQRLRELNPNPMDWSQIS